MGRFKGKGANQPVKVLITGGAGFIGTALCRRLLREGHELTVLDNFSQQIHGDSKTVAADLKENVRLVIGDVRDESAWKAALSQQEAVIHLAAETGTGQSMYQVRHYTDVNVGGTASLIELLLTKRDTIRTLVVASSRAVYGEGAYNCRLHGTVYPAARSSAHMKRGEYEPKCPECGDPCATIPTPESAPFRPSSLYGLSKQIQEQLVLMYAQILGCNGFALRYQNVFGPGQSLKNPYTGILAVFSNQARANGPIYIFEDGQESRDFVFIEDVVEATVQCLRAGPRQPSALNVGSGRSVTVMEVVQAVVSYFQSNSAIAITGSFREGDIRHNSADLSRVHEVLGYSPRWSFEQGIDQFLNWSTSQKPSAGRYEQSLAEMRTKGLMHG